MIYLTDGNGNTSIKVPLVADSSGNMFVPEITDTLGDDREIYLLNTRLYLPAGQAMAFFPSRRCPGIVHAADDYNTDGTLKAGRAGQNKPVMPLVSMAKTYGADTASMPYVQIDDTDPENPVVTSANMVTENTWVDSLTRYATAIQPYWDYTPSTGPGRTARFFHQPCVTRGPDDETQWQHSRYPDTITRTDLPDTITARTAFYLTATATPHVLRAFLNMGRLARVAVPSSTVNNMYRDKCVCMTGHGDPGWTYRDPGWYFDNHDIHHGVDPWIDEGWSLETARIVYPPAHPLSHAYQRALDGSPSSCNGVTFPEEVNKQARVKYHAWFVVAIPGLSSASAMDAWKTQFETYGELYVPVSKGTTNTFSEGIQYPYCYTTTGNGPDSLLRMTGIRVSTGYSADSHTGYLVIQGEYDELVNELNRIDAPRLSMAYPDNPGTWNRRIYVVGWGLDVWPTEVTRTCAWLEQYQDDMIPNFEYCDVEFPASPSAPIASWSDPNNQWFPARSFDYGGNVQHDGSITHKGVFDTVSGMPTTWDTFADQFG